MIWGSYHSLRSEASRCEVDLNRYSADLKLLEM